MRAGSPAAFGAVALGGAVGGALRYVLALALPDAPTGVAWTTLAVNVVGSFALGALVAGPLAAGAPAWLRPALGTGLIGGFTTWSAVAQQAQLTVADGAGPAALAYLALSLGLGVVGAAGGLALGARWALRRAESQA